MDKSTFVAYHHHHQSFDKSVTVDTNNKNERSVINLSSYVLSEIERSVLQKGLKFAPTPGEPDMNEILDDLRFFFRRMTLKAYFHESNNEDKTNFQPTLDKFLSQTNQTGDPEDELTNNKFKPKSAFDPKITYPHLEAFFVLVKYEIEKHTPSLQSNPSITIKKGR